MDLHTLEAQTFREKICKKFKAAGPQWEKEMDSLWAFGPKRVGANILLNHIPAYRDSEQWMPLIKKMAQDFVVDQKVVVDEEIGQERPVMEERSGATSPTEGESMEEAQKNIEAALVTSNKKLQLLKELDNSIVTGFQMATASGPLCEEPMLGVCFIVEDVLFKAEDVAYSHTQGPFTGQIIATMKDACRQKFLSKSVRLVEAMYFCETQVPSDFVGKSYNVFGRRRAKILNEEMKDGSSIFSIQFHLPVAESFGLSEEILKQTSGAASTQMMFHHWEVLNQDPFFVASTEEELEDIGENLGGIAPNLARQYIDSIRKRKGLQVEEKIDQHADKQRTRKKNK